jgi:putative sterol carrier protein
MDTTRRDFCKWLSLACASLTIPKLGLAEKRPEIVECTIITSYDLEYGIDMIQSHNYEKFLKDPEINLKLTYSDDSFKEFITYKKCWTTDNHNNILDVNSYSTCKLSNDEKEFEITYGNWTCKLYELKKVGKSN